MGNKSQYYRYLLRIKRTYGAFGLSQAQIKNKLDQAAIEDVLSQLKRSNTSMFATSTPGRCSRYQWFRAKTWVNDTASSKLYNEFRTCNTRMGNRGPTKDGRLFKLCPLCKEKGHDFPNNEIHLLIVCPEMTLYRNSCFLGSFIRIHRNLVPSISPAKLYSLFLDDRNIEDIDDKIQCLFHMKTAWENKMGM